MSAALSCLACSGGKDSVGNFQSLFFKSLIHCEFITSSDSPPHALRDFFILTDLNAIHSGMEAILEKKAVGKWRACSFGARLREGRGEIIPRQCVTHICGARRGFAAKRDLEFTRNEPSTASLRSR